MRIAAFVLGLVVLSPAAVRAEHYLDRLWFSAASPGYPAKEFWAPRLWRLHACHKPTSVSVCPPGHCDGAPGYVRVGPYCPGSQPHFPIAMPAKP